MWIPARLRRLGRWARNIAIIALSFGFVLALVGVALVISLRLPPVRAFAVAQANSALHGVFRGELRIEKVAQIGLYGVSGVDGTVFDAEGKRVLTVRGGTTHVAVLPLVWAILAHPQAQLFIDLGRVTANHAELQLIDEGRGSPTIFSAFDPPHPDDSANNSPPPTVQLRQIEVAHAWIHGRLGAAPAVDAELDHAVAQLAVVADTLSLRIDSATLRGRGLPFTVDPIGKIGGTLVLPLNDGSPIGNVKGKSARTPTLAVHAWYKGTLAGSQTIARFDWTGDRLRASLDSPHLEPASVARVIPKLRIRNGLALHATAKGAPSDLQIELRILASDIVPEATNLLHVLGHGNAIEGSKLDAEAHAENLNLAALLVDAPESRVGVVARVQLTRSSLGAVAGSFDWSSSPGQISGTPLPAIHGFGTIRQDPTDAITMKGQAQVLEPGAHSNVDFSAILNSVPAESLVSIDSATQLSDPERLLALANGLRARGSVELSARYWLDDGRWSMRSHASLRYLRQAGFHAHEIDVRAEATGGDAAPSGTVHLRARDVDAAGQSFRRLVLDATGSLERARVTATAERDNTQRVELTTELGFVPSLSVMGTRLVLPTGEGAIKISVQNVRSHNGKLRVDGFHLEGAGTAEASFTFGTELEQLELETVSLDWTRLTRILGIRSPVLAGHATLVARYANPGATAEGVVRGHVSEVKIGAINVASADVDIALDRAMIDATLVAQLVPSGSVNIAVRALPLAILAHPELALGSPGFSLSGHAAVELAELQPLIRLFSLPLDHASGSVSLQVEARGPSEGHERPEITARLETHSLELAGYRNNESDIKDVVTARKAQPWSLKGVDGVVDLTISGDTPRAEVSARLLDRRGAIIIGYASAELPQSIWPGMHFDVLEARRMPLVGTLYVPRRQLQRFPAIVRTEGMRGVASLNLTIEGTLEAPKFVIDGSIEGLSYRAGRIAGKRRLKLDVNLHADGSRERGRSQIEFNQRNRTRGNIEASWKGDVVRLMTASLDAPSPLRGNLAARFDAFPLEALPTILAQQFSGFVSGELALRNWGDDATLVATLEAAKLGLGNVVVEQASLAVDGSDGQLTAEVRLSGRKSGTLEANVTTNMSWGNRFAPLIDPGLQGGLVARGFQLAVLSQFFGNKVNEFEGSTDAKLTITLDKGVPRVEGQATLSRGVVQLPSIGQRFDSIGAHVTIHDGNLRIDDLRASGLTGRATGSASAQLDGIWPTSGEAHIAIAQGEQIPVTVEGQTVGDAWGRIDLTFERSSEAKTTKFRITLPELHLELPDVDPTNLQDLEPAEHVRIGVRRSDDRFVSLPVQPLKKAPQNEGEALEVELHLGNSVWIQKGASIRIQLGGDLLARMANRTTLEGRLELKGGKVDVSGKTFEVENGLVIFDGGDPGNPEINATARWDSSTEYRVYAQYIGTVKDGMLKLRSEPPLSPDQIVSMLMFGTPDGTFRTSGMQGKEASSTATAISIAGNSAVKGLNRTLAGMTKLDVSARLDTSTGTARPELDVQLTPRLVARMTRAIGEPTFGQSPDRTFLTFELRLWRTWVLSAVVGDRGGSALDLMWRRRY